MARIYSGLDGATRHTFYGDAALDAFGGAVSGVGDIDQDGFADVAVDATFNDHNGADAGMVRVFSGQDGSVMTTLYGENPGDGLGVSVDAAGDVNADGFPDLIVGAFWTNGVGSNSGTAYAFSGEWIAAVRKYSVRYVSGTLQAGIRYFTGGYFTGDELTPQEPYALIGLVRLCGGVVWPSGQAAYPG